MKAFEVLAIYQSGCHFHMTTCPKLKRGTGEYVNSPLPGPKLRDVLLFPGTFQGMFCYANVCYYVNFHIVVLKSKKNTLIENVAFS